jgi:hypothetical protein
MKTPKQQTPKTTPRPPEDLNPNPKGHI